MLWPAIGSPTPRWSRWAETTTYWLFSFGSDPSSLAIRLGELMWVTWVATWARRRVARAKPFSLWPASAAAKIEARVWPEPANRTSAWAGLKLAEKIGVFDPRRETSARAMEGRPISFICRDQAKSMALGRGMEITPTAPARAMAS